MDEFVAAFVRVRDRSLAAVEVEPADATVAYMLADARLSEAEIVAPCISRFVSAELRPPEGVKPVGRFGSISATPPVGKYLGLESDADDTVVASVRSLAMEALSYGYFAMTDAEATSSQAGALTEVVLDRDAHTIWPYWVTNMGTGRLLRSSVDPGFVRRVANVCGEDLLHGLRQLGLVGWRRRRVSGIGWFYAEAGMLLRVLQTDNFQPGPRSDVLLSTNAWPFEQMPVD